MKHLLPILTAVFALTATTASAAFTYDVETRDYDNSSLEGNAGKYYTVNFSGGSGKVYITDFFSGYWGGVNEPPQETLSAPQMGVTQYGYYEVDAEGNRTSELHFFNLSDENRVLTFDGNGNVYKYTNENGDQISVNRKGYLLGEFSGDKRIEIWMSDGTTSAASNTPVLSEDDNGDMTETHISTYGVRDNQFNVGSIATLYLGPGHATQVNFGLYAVATEGSDGGGTPVGSPLPGGLQIALIAGLFGLGFWYIRRRKAIAA